MKTIILAAVAVALFAVVWAEEDKKTKVVNFYKCISCTEDHAAKEEYMKCTELKPEKCKEVVAECKQKLIPEAKTQEECFEAVCKHEDLAEKLYDCIMDNKHKKELDEDEEAQLKEYVQCAKNVNKKFCGGE